MDQFKHSLEISNRIIVSYRNSYIRAIGRSIGEYKYKENTGIHFNYFRSKKGKAPYIVSYWFRVVNKIMKEH